MTPASWPTPVEKYSFSRVFSASSSSWNNANINHLGHTKLIIRLTDAATLICRFEKKKIKIPILFLFFLAATKSKAEHNKASLSVCRRSTVKPCTAAWTTSAQCSCVYIETEKLPVGGSRLIWRVMAKYKRNRWDMYLTYSYMCFFARFILTLWHAGGG